MEVRREGQLFTFHPRDLETIVEGKTQLWARKLLLSQFEDDIWQNPPAGFDKDDDLKVLAADCFLGFERLKINDRLRHYPVAPYEDSNLATEDVRMHQRVHRYLSRIDSERYRRQFSPERALVENFWQNFDLVFDDKRKAKELKEGIMTELAIGRFLKDELNFDVRVPSPKEDAEFKVDWLAASTKNPDRVLGVQVKSINIDEKNRRMLDKIARVLREPFSGKRRDPALSKDENVFLRGIDILENNLKKIVQPGERETGIVGLFLYVPRRISTIERSVPQTIDFDIGQITDSFLLRKLKERIEEEIGKAI